MPYLFQTRLLQTSMYGSDLYLQFYQTALYDLDYVSRNFRLVSIFNLHIQKKAA